MVNRIDQAQRRAVLAEAVWRLMAQGGLDAASVRQVATEAGLSTGSVRHFFSTQSELHIFAMETLSERVRARVLVAEQKPEPFARLEAILIELLPLTESTAVDYGVWLQFVLRAQHDEGLAGVAQRTFEDVAALLVRVVERAKSEGVLHPDLDTRATAAELNALIDGLTFELIAAPNQVTPRRARGVLKTWLEKSCAPPVDSSLERRSR